jgi:elongator complex protein 3
MTIEEEIIYKLIEEKACSRADFTRIAGEVYSAHRVQGYHRNVDLRDTYHELVQHKKIESNPQIEKLLVTKAMRSLSGVSIITVLTKPFECPGKCIYCPTITDVPKSYLPDEPAVMRAILNKYDTKGQVRTRLESLVRQGHPIDKIELIVIGGTFSHLPRDYQEEFVKGCYDALNGFVSQNLQAAKEANETAKSRCVGLTLETRPDHIDKEEAKWFRNLGATRVELGVQTVFDEILVKNGRGEKVADTIRATKLLKDAGFKICYHLMPNLYGSNIELDKKMFQKVFDLSDFRPDYIKIYPCMVLKNTPLYTLWQRGEYKSYTDDELKNLIKYVKEIVPPWVRIMRTIRDIPAPNIVSGSTLSNMRQIVLAELAAEGKSCGCIRCREVGIQNDKPIQDLKLFKDEYEANGGKEYFLSFEDNERKTLYSLLRLRLTDGQFIPEITDCALIREIHTYGQQVEVGEKGETQHQGLGKKLIAEAERIAKENGFSRIAVISGVGVRDYYRKFGYELVGEYMIKTLK